MSFRCNLHGWAHFSNPCPYCSTHFTYSTDKAPIADENEHLKTRIHELETLCQDLEKKLKKADEIIKRNMGSSLDEVISWPKGDK